MKATKIFFAALALIGALASCDPVDQPNDKPDEPSKSNECKLTAFVVTVGEETIEAFVDQSDKTIEVSYFKYQYDALKAATAVATISDKATISPDPATALDYTVEGGVDFTVTAEDGTTATTYKAFLALAEISEKCTKVWEKTFSGDLGLADKPNFDCGVAFCDMDKFVYADLRVFDLNGNYVGKLNTEGVTGLCVFTTIADSNSPTGSREIIATRTQLECLSNDANGVLVAIACFEGDKPEGASIGSCKSEVYAWLNGWDAKPTKIYGPVDYQCMYMSVAGDVKGDFVLNFRTGVTAPPQMHHVLVYKGGKYFKDNGDPACTWYGPMIEHPCNDGCWGQQLSFFSGDPEDGFVVWDSLAAAEYGESGNASAAFYVYNEGLTAFVNGAAEEVGLNGIVNWGDPWHVQGGHFSYGNYSCGHVRAFIYNGQKYIVACSSSWDHSWITVQKATDLVEDDEETDEVDESISNYLLPTDQIEGAAACAPCCAYVYDRDTRTGHIVYIAQNLSAVAYDITTTIL